MNRRAILVASLREFGYADTVAHPPVVGMVIHNGVGSTVAWVTSPSYCRIECRRHGCGKLLSYRRLEHGRAALGHATRRDYQLQALTRHGCEHTDVTWWWYDDHWNPNR